jgi:hypothetical protein
MPENPLSIRAEFRVRAGTNILVEAAPGQRIVVTAAMVIAEAAGSFSFVTTGAPAPDGRPLAVVFGGPEKARSHLDTRDTINPPFYGDPFGNQELIGFQGFATTGNSSGPIRFVSTGRMYLPDYSDWNANGWFSSGVGQALEAVTTTAFRGVLNYVLTS